MIEFPDFRGPLMRVAGSTEKLAGMKPGEGAVDMPSKAALLTEYRQKQAEASAVKATSQTETAVTRVVEPIRAKSGAG